MRPLGILLATAIMAAVVGRLWRRLHEASPLARRMLIPVLAIAGVRVGLAAVGLPLRMLGGEAPQQAPALEVVAWLIALCAPAMALAILAGFWRWDAHAARAVRRLAATLQTRPDPSALRRVMADAFEDSTLQLAFPADGSGQGWKDSAGQAVELPEPGSGRASSEVRSNGEVVAVVIHDEVLCEAPELIDAGTAMAAVVLENASLAAEADWAVQEARSSRRRITAAAERERRRIERDLHDSAQQRLVALRIELELAEELVLTDPERGAARLHELGGDLEETLDELRALAHGVYPPLLADRGLTEALRSATARSAIPVDVDSNDVRRYPPEVESAVYYCVLEAVQNALKHSRAQRIAVHLDGARNASLLLTVRDDGVGTPDGKIQPGAGIANMNERLVTVGGQLEISSTRGAGTVVRGTIPTPAA
jgi:signal transduction histidine kinase